jgi:hypothetical protein
MTITLEYIQGLEWYKSRPSIIRKAIDKLPPICLYKIKSSGKQCELISYEEPDSGLFEDVTVTVEKTGIGGPMAAMGMGELDYNQVFGLKLDDLEQWPE